MRERENDEKGFLMAMCYDRLKSPVKALECAERALRAAPKNQSIRENLERYRKAAESAALHYADPVR